LENVEFMKKTVGIVCIIIYSVFMKYR
jgi:hypothetical protein